MIRRCAMFVAWPVVVAAVGVKADEPLDRLVYPLAAGDNLRGVKFEVDLSEVADDTRTADWAGRGQALCSQWFPIVGRFLATDGWTPPTTVRLVFKKDLKVPGATSGATIEVSRDWITQHPDDFGMLIHELTHVVQAYPAGTNPGWLVEGIADYIRYWRYEPERPQPVIDPKQSNYRQGYGTTAAFLAWLVQKYDHRLIHRLDDALRHERYRDALFTDATGHDLDTLWKQFIAEKR
jgi:hypothetical protein